MSEQIEITVCQYAEVVGQSRQHIYNRRGKNLPDTLTLKDLEKEVNEIVRQAINAKKRYDMLEFELTGDDVPLDMNEQELEAITSCRPPSE